MTVQQGRQADRIFHRHAGPLCQILQRWVGRITQQGNPALGPVQHRITVAQNPVFPVPAPVDDLTGLRMHMSEAARHLLMRTGDSGCRVGRVVVIGHDKVEDLPAA